MLQNSGKVLNIFSRVFSRNPVRHSIYSKKSTFLTSANTVAIRNVHHISENKNEKKFKKIENVEELLQRINDNHQVRPKLIENIVEKTQLGNLTEENILLLLHCCGEAMPHGSLNLRQEICEKIFNSLLQNNYTVTEELLVTYVKVTTQNRFLIDWERILKIHPGKPSQKLYKLILENVCFFGNTDQALNVLNIMKKEYIPADVGVFLSLVFAHAKNGGLQSTDSVLQTMRAAKIPEIDKTNFCILNGLICRDNQNEFRQFVKSYKKRLTGPQLLKLLTNSAYAGNHRWIVDILHLAEEDAINSEFLKNLENLCINLIHMSTENEAIFFHKTFIKSTSEMPYAYSLLREMVISSTPVSTLLEIVKDLKDSQLNPYALENIIDLTLRYNLSLTAWDLLQHLPYLRPHFFWPLFINANAKHGEKGVIDLLEKISYLNVKVDMESLENYILPFCDTKNPKELIRKFQVLGFTVKELLTPILVVLLRNNQTKLAYEICSSYNVDIGSQSLMKLLPKTWSMTKDSKTCVLLLQKICETAKTDDFVGSFLSKIIGNIHKYDDLKSYLQLITTIKESKLRISAAIADNIIQLIKSKYNDQNLIMKLETELEAIMDFGNTKEIPQIIHPRDMNVNQLECHYIELKHKNMETRGVLRKLIQEHSRLGNEQRVEALRKEFIQSGYRETPGMKSSVMHNYLINKDMDAALELYNHIKGEHPDFKIDEFKIIDLAACCLERGDFQMASKILKDEIGERNNINSKTLERNLRQLLISCDSPTDQQQILNILVERGYKPSNVLLGSLIRLFIEKKNLNAAVEKFLECSSKYNCTPLQVELLTALLKNGNQGLLEKSLQAVEKVHGVSAAQQGFIAALCEGGLKNQLRSFLNENRILSKAEFEKRCERWVLTNKLDPLITFLSACNNLSANVMDVEKIHEYILQIYRQRNDCEGALQFYENLLENDVVPSKTLEAQLHNLLKINKHEAYKEIKC